MLCFSLLHAIAHVFVFSCAVIIGRQYIDMTRGRVEGLYASFSKLIQAPQSAAAKADEQFTILENDTVRYLYQTLDAGAAASSSGRENLLYLVVVTTVYSNIIEDAAVLQNLYKLVNYITSSALQSEGQLTMMRVLSERFFDIVHGFDLVITPHGLLNESVVNLNIINTILEMDSMDEKIAQRDEENKTAAARQLAKQKAAFFKAQQHAAAHSAGPSAYGRPMGGFGGGGMPSSSASRPAAVNPSTSSSSSATAGSSSSMSTAPSKGKGLVLSSKKGLQLGAPKAATTAPAAAAPSNARSPAAPAAAAPSSSGQDLDVKIVEQLSVEMNQDATLNSIQMRGELSLCAQTEDAGFAAVQLVDTGAVAGAQFKTHPQIDKDMWSNSHVVCGKGDRPFPVGHDITVLKWMYSGDTTSQVQPPLNVTCWPTASRESILMTIEYEVSDPCVGSMKNIALVMPLPPEIASVQERESDVIEVGEVQDGTEFVYDGEKGGMVWHIGNAESADRKNGSIEFSINLERIPGDIDFNAVLQQLFPMHVTFDLDGTAASPLSPLAVDSVTQRHDASHTISFSQISSVKVVKYDILLRQF